MGAIANTLINGEACAECGVHFEPDEIIFVPKDRGGFELSKMPSDGSGYGVPIICKDCFNNF